MKEEEETKKHKVLVERPSHTHGDVAIVAVSPHTIVRMAAANASDRILPETIKLCPPVYNDLIKEVSQQCYFSVLYTVYISLLHCSYDI